jgi:DNA-binding PadR family transcriptional regulator
MRKGHRREYAAGRGRGSTSFDERCDRALIDMGVYGAVSYRDLAEARFDGHPHTTRRAVNGWVEDGIVTEIRATGPNGNPFKVLALTRKGVAEARDLAAERGMDPDQEIRFARARPSEAAHDTSVYRACRREKGRLRERGATVRRIRLGNELKSAVARASESARQKDGKRAADAERHRITRQLGLPVDDEGRVLYPDAQIEYTDADGRTGRVNIEAVSGNYREPAVRAKAAAGFALHANGPAAAGLLRRLGVGNERGSWLRGPADRDPATVEL